MEKGLILAALKLLYERVEKNECTGAEMEMLSRGLTDAVNPLMTRKQLARHFDKTEEEIDIAINRKLSRKDKIRNIVMYPLDKINKLFQ